MTGFKLRISGAGSQLSHNHCPDFRKPFSILFVLIGYNQSNGPPVCQDFTFSI